jgi:hypothetical protein
MAVYGYARVSTDGQSLAAQLAELKAAKCAKIFQEKISGARSDRKQLSRLMAVLARSLGMPRPFLLESGSPHPANGSTTIPMASSSRRASCAPPRQRLSTVSRNTWAPA